MIPAVAAVISAVMLLAIAVLQGVSRSRSSRITFRRGACAASTAATTRPGGAGANDQDIAVYLLTLAHQPGLVVSTFRKHKPQANPGLSRSRSLPPTGTGFKQPAKTDVDGATRALWYEAIDY